MRQDRVIGLDGMRALAILGVVFYHMIPHVVPGGFLGVTAFFTIMGYLMVYPLAKDQKRLDSEWVYGGAISGTWSFAWEYYKKKIKRLYPPLLVMLIIGICGILFLVPDYAKGMLPEVVSILGGYNNWWQILQNASYFERMLNSSPFTHLWYLGLTVQYYLLYPLIFAVGYGLYKKLSAGGTRQIRPLFVLFLLALAIGSAVEMAMGYDPKVDPSRLYYGTDTRAFSLLFGMAIGLMPLGRISDGMAAVFLRIGAGVLLLVTGISYFTVSGDAAANYHYQMQMISLAFGVLLIAILLDQDTLGEWADILPLRIIGRYSYEVYLVMYPVIFFVQKKRGDLSNILYVILCVVLIAAAAAVVHVLPRLLGILMTDYLSNVWLKRAIPVMGLILCLGLCTVQTVISRHNGGTEDMAALEEELNANAASLATTNDEQLQTALLAQLSSVNDKVGEQTAIVEMAAQIRATEDAEAAAAALAEQQAAAAAEADATAIPATVAVTCVGDSVMLGASGQLQAQIPGVYVSAAVSRQVAAGPELINTLSAQGLLGKVVVIHLGTNGVSTLSRYQEIVDTIGADHQIYWINCQGPAWAGDVNVNVQSVCDANDNVTMIDWQGASAGHPEYFGSDNIHLTESGKAAYADLVRTAIGI